MKPTYADELFRTYLGAELAWDRHFVSRMLSGWWVMWRYWYETEAGSSVDQALSEKEEKCLVFNEQLTLTGSWEREVRHATWCAVIHAWMESRRDDLRPDFEVVRVWEEMKVRKLAEKLHELGRGWNGGVISMLMRQGYPLRFARSLTMMAQRLVTAEDALMSKADRDALIWNRLEEVQRDAKTSLNPELRLATLKVQLQFNRSMVEESDDMFLVAMNRAPTEARQLPQNHLEWIRGMSEFVGGDAAFEAELEV